MLEQLFGINYTGSVEGNVYGYHVVMTDGGYEAIAHWVTPTGRVYAGQVDLSHCVTVADQGRAVKSYMKGSVA
jgi:hypothetical protein